MCMPPKSVLDATTKDDGEVASLDEDDFLLPTFPNVTSSNVFECEAKTAFVPFYRKSLPPSHTKLRHYNFTLCSGVNVNCLFSLSIRKSY